MMMRNLMVFAFAIGVAWQPVWSFADEVATLSAEETVSVASGSQDSAPGDTGSKEQDKVAATPAPTPASPEKASAGPTAVKSRGAVRELHDVGTAMTIPVHDAIRSGMDTLGVLEEGPSGKVLLSVGDMVSVRFEKSAQPKAHDSLVVVRPTQTVKHPRSHQTMGQMMKVVGMVELDQDQGSFWSARIVRSMDVVSVGDLIVSAEPEVTPPSGSVTTGDEFGYVVAVPDDQVLIGAFQTVHTDLGSDHGVRPGQILTIVREGSKGSRGISRTIGEARVVSVQATSSSVLVTKSVEPIEIGDRIKAQ